MPSFLDDYEPVEDRIRAFWADHPQGRINTEMVHVGTDGYIVKALIWSEKWSGQAISLGLDEYVPGEKTRMSLPDATGYAQEAVSDNPKHVNATSALENCETSAIGRALANLGYAAKGKRPSREEMRKTANRPTGTSSPAEEALGKVPVGEDTTSGGGEKGRPSHSSTEPPPDEAREGEELREEPPPAMGPPDVEYPSRRPCLHLNGTNTVFRKGMRFELCVDCGAEIEEVRR